MAWQSDRAFALPVPLARGTARRTLLISTVPPYPKSVGKQVVLGGFCDYFLNRGPEEEDFRVLSFEPLSEAIGGRGFPSLAKPNLPRKLWNAFWYTLLLRDKSLQESFFWSPLAREQIRKVLADFDPHLVIFDTLRAGQYEKGLDTRGRRTVLYLDDLFSVRYERLLQTMRRFPGVAIDALGNFARHIPQGLIRLYRATPGIQRFLLNCERSLITRSENSKTQGFDLALLISAEEVVRLRDRSNADNVHAIPPLISMDETPVRRQWDGSATFVFLGSLNLPHNGFSIEWFIATQLARMIEDVPGFHLRIVGQHASDGLKEAALAFPGHVSLEGFVDDIDAILASSAGMIAPLLFGSGVKIKVIDALRLGVPVIATSFGAEGISAGGSEGLIVENHTSRFARHCRALLDPQVNARHSRAARDLFEDNFSAESVTRCYDEYFQSAATAPMPFRPSGT